MQRFIDKLKQNGLKEQFSGRIFKVQNSHIPETQLLININIQMCFTMHSEIYLGSELLKQTVVNVCRGGLKYF